MHTTLNLHGIIPSSRVNGPGTRSVVFFQGCRRGCAGCFNPGTHTTGPNILMTVEEALRGIPASGIDGLTVSGGEPFLQPDGLFSLLSSFCRERRGLSVVVYTGYTLAEIEAQDALARILPFIDVLVAGPYRQDLPEETPLARGSTNQTFHFLSSRHSLADMYLPARLEVVISPSGELTGTGFSRLQPLMGMT